MIHLKNLPFLRKMTLKNVPNFESLVCSTYKYKWNQLCKLGHKIHISNLSKTQIRILKMKKIVKTDNSFDFFLILSLIRFVTDNWLEFYVNYRYRHIIKYLIYLLYNYVTNEIYQLIKRQASYVSDFIFSTLKITM